LIFARKNAVKCELCGERALLRRLVEKVHPEKGINATLVHFAINFDEIVKKKKTAENAHAHFFVAQVHIFVDLRTLEKKKKKKKKRKKRKVLQCEEGQKIEPTLIFFFFLLCRRCL
jgi:hypothetical protein